MKLLTWLDWFNVLAMCPVSHPRTREAAGGIPRERLLEAIHCVTPEGRVYRGARAIRFIGLRMPVLIPTALFLWIPGVIWVAEHCYMTISRNRHLLSRWFGCQDACTLLPQRVRQNEQGLLQAPEAVQRTTESAAEPPAASPAILEQPPPAAPA